MKNDIGRAVWFSGTTENYPLADAQLGWLNEAAKEEKNKERQVCPPAGYQRWHSRYRISSGAWAIENIASGQVEINNRSGVEIDVYICQRY